MTNIVVEVYSKPGCTACNSLKQLLNTQYKDVVDEVKVYTLGEDVTVDQLTTRLGYKPRAVPQVFINDNYVGGFNKTVDHLNTLK